jgi:hypothetical protein
VLRVTISSPNRMATVLLMASKMICGRGCIWFFPVFEGGDVVVFRFRCCLTDTPRRRVQVLPP